MNDYQFKLVRLQGEFVWHQHEDTDETFIVLEGELTIDLESGPVVLSGHVLASAQNQNSWAGLHGALTAHGYAYPRRAFQRAGACAKTPVSGWCCKGDVPPAFVRACRQRRADPGPMRRVFLDPRDLLQIHWLGYSEGVSLERQPVRQQSRMY